MTDDVKKLPTIPQGRQAESGGQPDPHAVDHGTISSVDSQEDFDQAVEDAKRQRNQRPPAEG